MSNRVLVDPSILTDIADAIRAKTGGSATIAPSGMASAISGIVGKEAISWHQCPEAVRNYLANVTYDPSDYTTSQIATYAPSTAVSSNTKPVGKTVDGTTYYNNIPDEAEPFATANKAGTLTALDQLRWINSSTANMRDLGGWACDGGTVKYGKLFRGAIPQAADKALAASLGIKVELDIRGKAEAQQTASVWDIEYVCTTNYIQYSTTGVPTWKEMLRCVFVSIAHNKPVYFHCTYGADRTGTLACVLEGILGVSQGDIDKDYELTSFATGTGNDSQARRRNETEWRTLINGINSFTGSTFRDKCINFVASCGFTAAEINAFRVAMIDGSPATVTPTITTYTVTNTLSNVTTDGSSSIQQNKLYEAKITPDEGCILESVSVTMGNTDVTESAVQLVIEGNTSKAADNHYALIKTARVTGNIVVTASALTGARLPNDYQEVEWIGSTGTQTIQIEFPSDRIGAYIVHQIMRTASGSRSLIGSASTNSSSIGAAAGTYWGWTTANKYEMGGSSTTDVEASDSQFDIVKFEWYAKNSGKLTVNDTVLTQRAGSSSDGYTKYNVFGTGTYAMSCRQKEIAVYGVAGGATETAHLVPCYRKADGVIGFYDIIGNEFLTNIGTGSFSKGADV